MPSATTILPNYLLTPVVTKLVAWKWFFTMFDGFCHSQYLGKERLFQGITREIRKMFSLLFQSKFCVSDGSSETFIRGDNYPTQFEKESNPVALTLHKHYQNTRNLASHTLFYFEKIAIGKRQLQNKRIVEISGGLWWVVQKAECTTASQAQSLVIFQTADKVTKNFRCEKQFWPFFHRKTHHSRNRIVATKISLPRTDRKGDTSTRRYRKHDAQYADNGPSTEMRRAVSKSKCPRGSCSESDI